MKNLSVLVVILLLSIKSAFSQSTDAVLGMWLNEEKDVKVFVYKTSDKYFGKIIWLKEPTEADGKTPKMDVKNSTPALRDRPIQNMVILSKFVYKDGEWVDGEIYDPKSGKTYRATMKLKGNTLQLRGYVGLAAFGRTTEWTRSN